MTTTRDSTNARTIADDRLKSAERVVQAVAAFHQAADTIDAAEESLAQGRTARNEALAVLRAEGLRIGEITVLTGLSATHVQSLKRDREGVAADA